MQHLPRLVGHWKGTGTVTETGKVHPMTLKMRCESESGGWGVGCRSTMRGVPGVATLRESDLFGWNPNTRLTHWYEVTFRSKTTAGGKTQSVFKGTFTRR